jgi:hypothetical protein
MSLRMEVDDSSSDCLTYSAQVQIQGLKVPQGNQGGRVTCSSTSLMAGDCSPNCQPIFWSTDVTSILDSLATSGEIDISDDYGTDHLVVDRPTPMATMALRGVSPGDAVATKDLLADLTPLSTMSPTDFGTDAPGGARFSISATGSGSYGTYLQGTSPTLAPTEGPWAFNVQLPFDSSQHPDNVPRSVDVDFRLVAAWLSFSVCSGRVGCAGSSRTDMLRLPLQYAP